ncbi:MAG: fimbrillin family protein [Bacteroidales bacterium]|nr:fimbrillin family protein [Bacteroidales bacterium]
MKKTGEVLLLLLLCSCTNIEDWKSLEPATELSFTASINNFGNDHKTKSNNDNVGEKTLLESHFLGMLGKDSIYLDFVEERVIATKAIYEESPVDLFYVTAYMNDGRTKYMENIEYQHNNASDWTTSPKYFWPKDASLNFFAHSLSKRINGFSTETTIEGNKYSTSFTYTLPQPGDRDMDAQAQPDIIIAIAPQKSYDNNPVELDFIHTSAAVRFQIGDMPEDVTVNGAVISLSNVISKGKCTVTYPITESSVVWSNTSNQELCYRQSYGVPDSDGILGGENETFVMIPQSFKGSNAKINISLLVGESYFDGFELDINEFGTADAPHQWKAGYRYTYRMSKRSGNLDVDITENVTPTVKENVFVQNTGWVTSHIRVAVVGYWSIIASDGVEEIVASWDIDDTNAGTLVKSSDWDTYWEKGSDGFYYYKELLYPGEYTKVALFDKYELKKTTGPVSGSHLFINVIAQAIEKDKAVGYWAIR